MTTTVDHQATPGANRDVLFALGMTAVSVAAAVSSYSGLASLADLAGWNHRLALLLPLTIDAYALTATRVWLSPRTAGRKARRWAKGNAIGAIATSVAGNAVAHAANAHVFHVGWPVVVAVSAIPSIVLGLITHLWHLRNTPDPAPVPATISDASPDTATAPAPGPAPVAASPAVTTVSPPRQQAAARRPSGRPKSAQETAKKVVTLAAKYPTATIADLAKRAGVSESTVRRALTPPTPTTPTAAAAAAPVAVANGHSVLTP